MPNYSRDSSQANFNTQIGQASHAVTFGKTSLCSQIITISPEIDLKKAVSSHSTQDSRPILTFMHAMPGTICTSRRPNWLVRSSVDRKSRTSQKFFRTAWRRRRSQDYSRWCTLFFFSCFFLVYIFMYITDKKTTLTYWKRMNLWTMMMCTDRIVWFGKLFC